MQGYAQSGVPLTLLGINFGVSAPTVTVGGAPCPVTSFMQYEIQVGFNSYCLRNIRVIRC
jgi:hypothetical protein